MPTTDATAAAQRPTWSRPVCWLASILIAWHLAAVLVGPISLPPSILGAAAQSYGFRRYTELVFLNHAYKFFAPDPGPSHLIRYEIEMPDGSKQTGVFPNLSDEWPRLYYHRHFMLSERIANGPPDADTPMMMVPDWTRRPVTQWERGLAQSYANHLLAKYQGHSVAFTLVQHMLPSPEQVQGGVKLDHPESYVTRPLGTYFQRRDAMKLLWQYLRELGQGTVTGWTRFWFAPSDPATLGLIRILAGAMLLYTHLVWSRGLIDFFGPQSWISADAAKLQTGDTWAWSYFWKIESPVLLWVVHLAALVVFTMLTIGLFSRIVSVLAFVAAVSYVNRTPGALFGLDQINCMLATYLMVGPSGDAFSLDRWLAARRAGEGSLPPAQPSTGANVAIRLMQLHMCIIYFFAGLSKMQGAMWWSGTAMWGALANLEYQSLDMTWLHDWPIIIALMTQITAYWELTFAATIWPRLTRPIVLAIAIPLHLGIGLFLGMWTFGLVMLIGCVSFVSPVVVRRLLDRHSADRSADAESDEATDETVRRPASAKLRRPTGATR